MSIIVNIGLKTEGAPITPIQAHRALVRCGACIVRDTVKESATELTLVAELLAPLTAEQAESVAILLSQDCIAQCVDGVGALHGPRADAWGAFNPDYFLAFTERKIEAYNGPGKHYATAIAAKGARDARARALRAEGYKVSCKKVSFDNLGYGLRYTLDATRGES